MSSVFIITWLLLQQSIASQTDNKMINRLVTNNMTSEESAEFTRQYLIAKKESEGEYNPLISMVDPYDMLFNSELKSEITPELDKIWSAKSR